MKRFSTGLILIAIFAYILAHYLTPEAKPIPAPPVATPPMPGPAQSIEPAYVPAIPAEIMKVDPSPAITSTPDVTLKVELNLDAIDLEAPDANLALMDLARQEDTDPEILYDLVVNLGPQGYPALGVLADRLQAGQPERASEIIDMLFDSLEKGQEPNNAMLISWALMNVSSIDYTDQLYASLQHETNPEVRYRLFGVLSSRTLDPDEKERFQALALHDPSPFIRDLGRDWERSIEGKGQRSE